MAGKTTTTTEIVAYLYAVERKSPKQIANFLGKSEVTVWRYLTAARGDTGCAAARPQRQRSQRFRDGAADLPRQGAVGLPLFS